MTGALLFGACACTLLAIGGAHVDGEAYGRNEWRPGYRGLAVFSLHLVAIGLAFYAGVRL